MHSSKNSASTAALLMASLILANLANLAIQFVIPRVLLPAEYTQFAMTWASGQLLAAVLFEWLRIGTVRYSGSIDESVGHDLRQTLISLYVLVLSFAGLSALVMLLLGLKLQGLFWAGFVLFYATAQGAFDGKQAKLRASFQNLKFSLIWTARSILSFLLAVGAAQFFGGAAYAVAGLCLSFFIVILCAGDRRGAWVRPRPADVLFLAKYGFFAASAGIITYIIPLAARYLIIHMHGGEESAGAVLSLDIAQKVVMALGTAANLLMLQPVISRVASKKDTSAAALGEHLSRMFALMAPVLVGFVYLNSFAAKYFVPPAFNLGYEEISTPAILAATLLCIKSFGVDALFVIGGRTGLSAISALLSAILAALGWWALHLVGALSTSSVMYVLLGSLLSGLIASLVMATKSVGLIVPWTSLLKVGGVAACAAALACALLSSSSEAAHWTGGFGLIAFFILGYLYTKVDGISSLLRGRR